MGLPLFLYIFPVGDYSLSGRRFCTDGFACLRQDYLNNQRYVVKN